MSDEREFDAAELVAGARRVFEARPADEQRVLASVRRTLNGAGASDRARSDVRTLRPNAGSGVVAKLSIWTVGLGVVAAAIVQQVKQPTADLPAPVLSERGPASTPQTVSELPEPNSAQTPPPRPGPVQPAKRDARARARRDEASRKPAKQDPPLDQSALPATPPPAVSLQAELEALRRVELALREGQPARALAILDELKHQVPDGKLDEERGAAQVIARCALDPTARAALLEDYVRRHPKSMYLRRIEMNCRPKRDPPAHE